MSSDSDRRHQALLEAQQAIGETDWRAAARALERAARTAKEEGDSGRAAHCLQMAAALHRARGDSARAIETAARAKAQSEDDPRVRFAGEAERGEALMAAGHYGQAVEAYRAALDAAEPLELPPWARATLIRRLAEAMAGLGDHADAWRSYDEAAELMVTSAGDVGGAWVDVEQANRAWQSGLLEHAMAVVDRSRTRLSAEGDAHLRGERLLLMARVEAAQGSFQESAELAGEAREAALEAVAPLSYFGAAVVLAQARETLEDRLEAYAALATAWATLGDLLGRDVAESWVAPILTAYRVKWGPGDFQQVKDRHDQARRESAAGGRDQA